MLNDQYFKNIRKYQQPQNKKTFKAAMSGQIQIV